jgi:membrane protease YdiL (CAAX protease family)
VRALIVRLTAIAATAAALLSGLLTAVTHAPWTVAVLRGVVAFALVAAVGIGFGLILMRTAIRRHYEEALEASRRARGNR